MTEPAGSRRAQHTDSSFPVGTGRMGSVGHLTTEAIAAYVDGELRMGPHMRASAHLGGCLHCAAAVEVQRSIRADLQRCARPAVPDSLLGSLRSIPHGLLGLEDGPDSAGGDKPRWRWPF